MKALVVDDCKISRMLLVNPLSSYAEVDEAENGIEAIQKISKALSESSGYDLVCLDLNMPEMDGFEVLREIRAIEAKLNPQVQTVVFMITASNSPDDMLEMLLTGSCDDYLNKPVINKTLIELMQKHNLLEKTG